MDESGCSLVIGDKNYSSWSLRPWLAMRRFAVPFREINVDLYSPGKRERILEHSPTGFVPVLKVQGRTVWDSMAIIETLAETFPGRGWWPEDAADRSLARSICAEMHSGFGALRTAMPMDLLHEKPMEEIPDAVGQDIARVVDIWTQCRARSQADGPFLFGAFSIADAMYAPVASRFRTYAGALERFGGEGGAQAYCAAIFAMPEMAEWAEGARAEIALRGRAC